MRNGPALVAGIALALWARPAGSASSIYDNACPIRDPLSASELTMGTSRAVFQVKVTDVSGKVRGNGTATLIDRRGYFLTAGHVVEGYAEAGTGTVRLQRYDGVELTARVIANFVADGMDVAVLLVPNLPVGTAEPVPLRISSPFASGAPSSGWVIAYSNDAPTIEPPLPFSFGGYATAGSTMTIRFLAKGGNSGALLLEPNGRAFGLLREGADPGAMQIPLFAPVNLVPGKNGRFAVDVPISMLPEDVQAAVDAALKSKALSVSSFWDRLASVIPPSPGVETALDELRARGWRNVVPGMVGRDGYNLSAVDVVHFFRRIGTDEVLLQRAINPIGSAFNVVAETCSEDAFQQFVVAKAFAQTAAFAAKSVDRSPEGISSRAMAAKFLTAAVRMAATAPATDAESQEQLVQALSDLALVQAQRARLGETDARSVIHLVAMAEALGGTPTTGELAYLIAAGNGDSETGAVFLAAADTRLRDFNQRASDVIERRNDLARIFNRVEGPSIFGARLASVTPDEVDAGLRLAAEGPGIARLLAGMSPTTASKDARTLEVR